jgi:hypothetical protein
MKTNLDQCVAEQHQHSPLNMCQDSGDAQPSTFLPTRLLDISCDAVRLIHTAPLRKAPEPAVGQDDMNAIVRYAALSYCRGNYNDATTQLKLTKRNLTSRCENIPVF